MTNRSSVTNVTSSRRSPAVRATIQNLPGEKLNHHANLLLLCKVHHKLIDDQQSEYTASRLAKMKALHEKWVSEQLDSSHSRTRPLRVRRTAQTTPAFLRRIRSGKELLDIVTHACAFAPHHDDLRNEAEDELVAGFLQDAQDWGELGLDSVRDRMRAARSLDEHIGELERAGLWVFAHREKQIPRRRNRSRHRLAHRAHSGAARHQSRNHCHERSLEEGRDGWAVSRLCPGPADQAQSDLQGPRGPLKGAPRTSREPSPQSRRGFPNPRRKLRGRYTAAPPHLTMDSHLCRYVNAV